ncbi:hypothetical protein BDV93DRAFT_564924 [Ceratobasidium sp. AG-I]|nr:hypothetical protein BDV93DRAFT_564924 [Ceratobasidium sp. AG-I]
MSKRKVGPGGYLESSDDSEVDATSQTTSKKPRPYKPPMANMIKKPGANAFLLPRLNTPGSSARASQPPAATASSSSRPTPIAKTAATTSHMPTPKDTPLLQKDISLWDRDLSESDAEKDYPTSPVTTFGQRSAVHTAPPPVAPQPQETMRARSNISIERAINDLTAQVEAQIRQSEQSQKETDQKLTAILETIDRLVVVQQAVPAPTPAPAPEPDQPPADKITYLTNPALTPELSNIIIQVCGSAPSRSGKSKESNALQNGLRAHTRDTWYGMLRIAAAKDVGPYFEDANKQPDTLPAQFRDKTGYCQPYPHLRAPLTKQMIWVPTFMLRFKKTISVGDSEVSKALRDMSDYQIVVLLHDGPFKTAQNEWRRQKLTVAQLDEMRAEARRKMRADRTATTRGSYFRAIPSLQGPEYGFLWNSGYVSREVSDGEGGTIIERVTSVYALFIGIAAHLRVDDLRAVLSHCALSFGSPNVHGF